MRDPQGLDLGLRRTTHEVNDISSEFIESNTTKYFKAACTIFSFRVCSNYNKEIQILCTHCLLKEWHQKPQKQERLH